MNEEIKRQIIFVLDDDNEVMTTALGESDLDQENKQMNRELIKKHEAIIAKVETGDRLAKEDLDLIRGANEIHLNDESNVQEHHHQAVALNEWLDRMTELGKEDAMKILEGYLDKDSHTPAKVYRALHTLWEESTPNDVIEPPFDDEGKCLKCGSKVSFADVTDTLVFVADEIVKRYDGDITNRNCIKCTYPKQYPEYEHYDKE